MARIEVLVTVKAYPAISKKYGEVVCVAGVRADTIQPEWVRLWPVPFREMPFDQRFSKYQLITLDAEPTPTDTRPESLLPNIDSLKVGKEIKPRRNWKQRAQFVEPLEVESMCEIRRRQELDGTSLGFFRPIDVDMHIEPVPYDEDLESSVQPSLFFPNKTRLELIPYRFVYDYRCAGAGCPGHHQSNVDWEIAQAFRKWRLEYESEERTLDAIKEKWVNEMFAEDRRSRLFVGNMHQHPGQFLILGVYWPKI